MTHTKPSTQAERFLSIVLWILRLDILAGIIWMLAIGNWEAFFINILALALTFAPYIVSRRYGIKLPLDFIVVIVAFIYASMFLGSTFGAYERFFWWDAMLHTASGIVLSFIAFLFLFTMYKDGRLKTSPFIIAVFSFSFGLALGGVWEIFEFSVDSIFGTNMQKNGLSDTMWDLIVDALGSLLVAWMGYDTIKHNRKNGILLDAIERYLAHNQSA
jgi:hypothetical protein